MVGLVFLSPEGLPYPQKNMAQELIKKVRKSTHVSKFALARLSPDRDIVQTGGIEHELPGTTDFFVQPWHFSPFSRVHSFLYF